MNRFVALLMLASVVVLAGCTSPAALSKKCADVKLLNMFNGNVSAEELCPSMCEQSNLTLQTSWVNKTEISTGNGTYSFDTFYCRCCEK